MNASEKVDANEIMPGLWIGDYHSALNYQFIKKNKIKAIVNMTPDIPNAFEPKGVTYYQVKLDDSLLAHDVNIMYDNLPGIVKFIRREHDTLKKSVLVHCHQGFQRSATVVLAYLMLYHRRLFSKVSGKMSINKVATYIQKGRPIAFHGSLRRKNLPLNGGNINFLSSLKKYKKDLISKKLI